jgi:urease accessory protein
MPRSPRKRREAAAGAETAALQKQNKQKKHIEKLETRETHSWLDAVWGLAPRSGLALVASRDAAARDACARGALEVSRSGGRASATRLFHAYPLRLICPRRAGVERASGADCVWCYQVSFGGGLVAGDRAGTSVDVKDGCACVVATQGTNKVYKHEIRAQKRAESLDVSTENGGSDGTSKTSRETVQALAGRVGANALLACLPDPTQAFRDARFRQTQRFLLHPTASLVSVDWLVSGRAAFRGGGAGGFVSARGGGVAPGTDARLTEGLERGERWCFGSYRADTEVFVELARDRLATDDAPDDPDDADPGGSFAEVCAEAFRLEGDRVGALAKRMGDTHALATAILLGPRCAAAARHARLSTRAAAAATVAGGAKRVFANHSGPLETQNSLGDSGDSQKKSWLLCSVSPVPAPLGCDEADGGGIVLRVAGSSTDLVYATLREALAPLADELGAAPYAERGLS